MQQIEVRLVAITLNHFSPYTYTPFYFSRTLPLNLLNNNFLITFNQGGIIKVIFTGICVGITVKQGYNTASKYIESPMSTQVQELPLKGRCMA